MGPHTFNFAEAAERAEAAGAAVRVQSLDEGVRQAAALAVDGPRRAERAELAARFAQAHRGAATRTADAILALVAQHARQG
jgi:3-deoxy-D-manno-octulosonic-acid transferase